MLADRTARFAQEFTHSGDVEAWTQVLVPAVSVIQHPVGQRAPQITRTTSTQIPGWIVQLQLKKHAEHRL